MDQHLMASNVAVFRGGKNCSRNLSEITFPYCECYLNVFRTFYSIYISSDFERLDILT